jgi:type VI secretion system protein
MLVLHLTANDADAGRGAGRRIEVEKRLTIGRGQDNDLVLDDPERHLSKNHCVVDFDGVNFTITDLSTNGLYLDNQPERLPRNLPTPLHEGSVLRLGGYRITVTAIEPSLSVPSLASREIRTDPLANDDALFGDPLAGAPVGRHAGQGLPPFASEFSGLSSEGGAAAAPLIPDDVDFLGGTAQERWQGASQPDHAPSDQAFFAPPRVTAEKIPDDWEDSALGTTASGSGLGRPAPVVPRPLAPPLIGAVGRGGAAEGAIAAFLAATGLSDMPLSDAEKVRVMKTAGEALALALKGLAEILAARASTKEEFRIERTAIGAAKNNPLKFSADENEALRALLIGRMPGFLNASEAVGEAIKDIKSHQLAVLAGMQAALATVLARFDPEKLEKRLEQGSLMEGILPAARKARLWDRFKELYEEIAGEVEDDFQKAFGAAFARAYRKQVDRL